MENNKFRFYVGWAQALFSVLVLWGLNNVSLGYSSQILNTNPIVLTCVLFSAGSFTLLLIGGSGPLSLETLRSVDTWGYGLSLLLLYIFGILLFKEIGATEGSFLQRVSVVLSVGFGWMILGRKPNKSQIVGTLAIITGLFIVACGIAPNKVGNVFLLVFLWSLCHMTRVFIAEMHRPHTAAVEANDPRSKCRVIGFVMFVVSMAFTSLLLILSFIGSLGGASLLQAAPTLQDFMYPPTIFIGIFLGIFLMAPLRYMEFASANAIKAENFLAITCFGSLSTLFWEWFTQPITGLSLKEFSNADLLAGIIITAGGMVMAVSKIRETHSQPKWKDYLRVSSQDIQLVSDTRDIIISSMEHFKYNTKRAASALEIPTDVIKAIIEDKKKVLALKPDVFSQVSRNYRINVAGCDSLTGLTNRTQFMTALKKKSSAKEPFSIMFIDLNRFKPVNDTYGHEAGDVVLKGVAERLLEIFPNKTPITRLGGDEFAILLNQNKQTAKSHSNKIEESLSQPFDYEGNKIIIGASVGIASYPEDGTDPEELLTYADKQMYKNKKDKR